jgi:gamma-glutamyltranspeptidase / glutathione hydrolase
MSQMTMKKSWRGARSILAAVWIAAVLTGADGGIASAAQAHHQMVAAEGELAAKAGLEILRRGGNAVDAAAAVSLALGVTNSASCGIGGGGFMLIYLAKTGQLYAIDYRERAPAAASATMYIRDGKPDEELARSGPLAVAVPGEIAGLDAALRRFGTMQFSEVAAPAIKLAREGFPLSPHMAQEVTTAAPKIARDTGLFAVFFDTGGAPLKAGATVHDPNLATLMERLGDEPVKNFYHGGVAGEIAAYMKSHGGIVTGQDLADYAPVWREPIHLPYRGYEVYAMPPPSSGGVVLEILAMMGSGHIAGLGVNSPPYLARLVELMRQGFVDRAQYADPAFAEVPLAHLLSPAHIAEARERALHRTAAPQAATAAHDHGTSNFCVVDKAGNVVDVTTTINLVFGAKMMVPGLGLILNDEMDDFSVAPGVPNAFKLVQAKANEIAPGKRPLSSMSPIIVLEHRRPVLVAGGSGGPMIISGVVQVAVDVLDFGLEPEDAVAQPRIHQQAEPETVFVGPAMPAKTTRALEQMGYQTKPIPELGAVSAIKIAPGDLHGAFDPRKGGGAVGD